MTGSGPIAFRCGREYAAPTYQSGAARVTAGPVATESVAPGALDTITTRNVVRMSSSGRSLGASDKRGGTMSQYTQVTLDRAQREALREELELYVSGWGDFQYGFRNGDREYVVSSMRRLRRLVAMMDAIGWSEQPDTPETLPVRVTRSMAAWARREAKSLVVSLEECSGVDHATDENLDAYAAFCAIGNPEAV
jgi:hypothetical protein